MYSELLDDSREMSRPQVQSMLSAAIALQAGIPFSSLLTGCTHNAHMLAELIEWNTPVPVRMTWTPIEEAEYSTLMARY